MHKRVDTNSPESCRRGRQQQPSIWQANDIWFVLGGVSAAKPTTVRDDL